MLYSIVVPVYNSEKSLQELYDRVRNVFEAILQESFELILVDDASKDSSYQVMESLHWDDSRVKIIQLAKNCGQHPALLCGMSFSKGDYVITMDDDLQHPPEEIPKLVDAIVNDKRYDVVVGKYASKKHNLIRNFGANLSNYISYKTYGKPKDIELTSFRIIKKFVVNELLKLTVDSPRVGNMLVQVNGNIGNVLVEHDQRRYGKSGYTMPRLMRDLVSNLITNSNFPLMLVRNIGIGSFFFSLILGIYYLVRYFIRGVSIMGFTTLALLVIAYSGLLLFGVGVIGDYLMRILNESKKMPKYFVRKMSIEDDGEKKEKSDSDGSNISVL